MTLRDGPPCDEWASEVGEAGSDVGITVLVVLSDVTAGRLDIRELTSPVELMSPVDVGDMLIRDNRDESGEEDVDEVWGELSTDDSPVVEGGADSDIKDVLEVEASGIMFVLVWTSPSIPIIV